MVVVDRRGNSASALLGRRLLELASEDVGDASQYLVTHLAEHVADAQLWDALAENIELLDRLDPRVLSDVLVRDEFGRGDLPPALVAAIAGRDYVTAAGLADRGLLQVLTRRRLGCSAGIEHPLLGWTRVAPLAPSVPLTGHTSLVTGVAFGRSGDGRLLLASCSRRPDGAVVGSGHRHPGWRPAHRP